jgi:outer membrane protein assembly factor BamB
MRSESGSVPDSGALCAVLRAGLWRRASARCRGRSRKACPRPAGHDEAAPRGTAGLPGSATSAAFVLLWAVACSAGDGSAPKTFGWRGNWTGLFPDADPPAEWGRIAKGVVAGMTCRSARPPAGSRKAGRLLRDGLIRDWLVVGPFPVADSVKDFAKQQVPRESELAPAEGDQAGGFGWKRLQLARKPDYERWGTTELDWIDLAEAVGYKPNRAAYAHTYLHCERPGRVTAVVEHAHGMKAWLNGEVVYADPQRRMALSSYVGISRQKQALVHHRSAKFEMDLKKGWNRLLVKLTSYNRKGWRSMRFAHRLVDARPVPYEEKNILWATELPERTNAAPVVVGERVFTVAEPDELLCLDKGTGKVLWRRLNGYYEATPAAQRAAHPAFKQKIAPLAEQLPKTTDYDQALELRRRIRDLLIGVDPKRYRMKWDGHLASHFGIVGFTTTPVSDGKHVWAFFGHGVVACYDLSGRRKWIRRLRAPEIRYSCSPALIGGKVIVLFGEMRALDARTGAVAWTRPEAGIASLIPARIQGTDVVSTRSGKLYRVSDGKLLWANPHIREGDTGWAAPVILDDVLYLPWSGIGSLIVADFSKASGDAWKPALRVIEVNCDHRRPNGEWLDRWTAGSPVIHRGIYYGIDQYGVFYAVDLKTGKTLYRRDVGFDELHHYNAIGVGASATLGGKWIYAIDNQGTCVVLEAARAFRKLAVHRIETVLRRDWPIPPQEILSNGPPVFDGGRIYIRGERYLYCIGNR